MGNLYTSSLLSLTVLIFILHGTWSIKCFICNTADPTYEVSEKACRYPEKDDKIKPTECTPDVMKGLKGKWMNEDWNWVHHSSNPYDLKRDGAESSAKEESWEFGSEERPGYKLKCMQEVLHKGSKPWLKQKHENFSQIVRFCEYRKEKENPACETPCDSHQLSKGSCYICCSENGCNAGNGLVPAFKIIAIPIVLTLSAFRRAF